MSPELAEPGSTYGGINVERIDRLSSRERHDASLAGKSAPSCPECRREPAINGGRCWRCRGESML